MYYKFKQIYNFSINSQFHLLWHYRKIVYSKPVPIWFSWDYHGQGILIIAALLLLVLPLLKTSVFILLYSVIWTLSYFEHTIQSAYVLEAVSVEYWILAICFLSIGHSLYLASAVTLSTEFRAALLFEFGLSFNYFLRQLNWSAGKTFIFCNILFFCVAFPQLGLVVFWSMPFFIEYFCLTALISPHWQDKNISRQSGTTFTALLGLDYDKFQHQFLDSLQEELSWEAPIDADTPISGEDMYVNTDNDFEFTESSEQDWEFNDFSSDEYIESDDLEEDNFFNASTLFSKAVNKKFAHLSLTETNDISFFTKPAYTKELLVKKYKTFLQQQDSSSDVQSAALDVEVLVNNNVFDETEVLSDIYVDDSDYFEYATEVFPLLAGDEDKGEDTLFLQYMFWKEGLFDSEIEDASEIGFGGDAEYQSPKWFWLSFFFQTLPIWLFVNLVVCISIFCFGIPNEWLSSTRESIVPNFVYLELLLRMTELLYTPWARTYLLEDVLEEDEFFDFFETEQPARWDFFQYMQPYFFRAPGNSYYIMVDKADFAHWVDSVQVQNEGVDEIQFVSAYTLWENFCFFIEFYWSKFTKWLHLANSIDRFIKFYIHDPIEAFEDYLPQQYKSIRSYLFDLQFSLKTFLINTQFEYRVTSKAVFSQRSILNAVCLSDDNLTVLYQVNLLEVLSKPVVTYDQTGSVLSPLEQFALETAKKQRLKRDLRRYQNKYYGLYSLEKYIFPLIPDRSEEIVWQDPKSFPKPKKKKNVNLIRLT